MKSFLLLLFSIFSTTLAAFAQGSQVEMADQMRADGKIYVVVAVILTIFLGLVFYLISLDRKISKIEKEKAL